MDKLYKIALVILRSFATPVFSFALSLLGIKFYNKQHWGEFIHLFTWVLLIAFLTSFGNKDYLIRKYSANPSKIATYFTQNISSRLILVLSSLLFFFFFPVKIAMASVALVVLIFSYQSLESLVIYHQSFLRQLIAESIGFIIIITYFSLKHTYSLETILYIYCLAYLIKISILLWRFKSFFSIKNVSFSTQELKNSFSFFLIIFTGFMASKIDLYVVNSTLSKENISEYQIGITAFLLLQSVSYLIILPFNKHLYRLPIKSVRKIKKILYSIALPLVFIGTLCIWFLLEKIIHLNLSINFYILGGLGAIPTYFFIVDIIQHYRNNNEKIILKTNSIGLVINLILTIFLIREMALVGAILSVFITQVVLLILYKTKWIK